MRWRTTLLRPMTTTLGLLSGTASFDRRRIVEQHAV
jgi:hypothetical protein